MNDKRLPIYDSIKAASGATKIPLTVLKAAKRAGCPAFRSNRFVLLDFIAWYFNGGADNAREEIDEQYERARKIRAEADAQERENKVADDRLLEPEIVQERINRAFGIIRQYLQAAEAELPGAVNPSDPQLARVEVARWAQKFWPLIRAKQIEDNDDKKPTKRGRKSKK